MDVPDLNDQEVLEFAAAAKLAGTSDDENAIAWVASSDRNQYDTIEGKWFSRWNGGADPTIPKKKKKYIYIYIFFFFFK